MDVPSARHYAEIAEAAAELQRADPEAFEAYARHVRALLLRLKMQRPRDRESRP